MIMIGVDAHKRSHTLVAADEAVRKLAEKTVAATSDGHLVAIAWAARWPQRTFALEDCRHLTRRLEIDLLVAGEAAVRVPPHLMADRSASLERVPRPRLRRARGAAPLARQGARRAREGGSQRRLV